MVSKMRFLTGFQRFRRCWNVGWKRFHLNGVKPVRRELNANTGFRAVVEDLALETVFE